MIRPAAGAHDYDAIGRLVAEYVGWIRDRYHDDARFVGELLDRQSLAGELAMLSTMYGAPNGRAFVAEVDGEIRGCGAYRRIDSRTCEMKRVFVPTRFQGAGLGRALCESLIAAAREEGYASMKLDTLDRMREAATMYRALGFRDCAPYHDYPPDLMPYIVFLALHL